MKERRDELGYEPTEHAIPTGSGREPRGPASSVRELPPARTSAALTWLHPGSTLAAGRFEIVSMLGMGGMGVVYSAWDTQRADQVALKTLHRADAGGIYRFKNEFRSLADVHHPNLVRLYELFFESDHWFFTMELVYGTRFDQWVRPNDQLDAAQLRAALLQLVDAIDAIHTAGKLHRDIKPNNVLVTDEGRVVVLDFGLVVEHGGGGRGQTLVESTVMGTPDYMAPEQAAGLPADVACDYYAIGVMLYEALTGKLPFEGHPGDVLAAKQQDAAPAAHSGAGSTDCHDLLELCDALLARSPQERPRAAAIRARLAHAGAVTPSAASSTPAASNRPPPGEPARPVGRERELEQLRAAYRASLAGHAAVMYVDGESGIGKTALCQAFLDELRGAGAALVLAGRCYEQESIPFKVLDPMLDDLSRQLRRLEPWRAAALLPRDAHALTQLFPSLTRVEAFAQAPARPIADAQERERRALTALHELLARIRDRQPLVIYLDDLQWMDADSAKVLRHLLVRRAPVALLWILCARTEDAARNPWLSSVREAADKNRTLAQYALQLGPLSDADARRLALRVLNGGDAEPDSAEAIARQAAGSPFFVTELARFVLQRGPAPELSLHTVVAARIDELPAAARRVLAVLAVAGRPLPMPVALAAADADYAALDQLRTAHLLRGGADSSQRLIDCYHDRIREQVREGLDDAALHAICERLSEVLSARNDADPELLSRCRQACGDRAGAARCLGVAAERAFDALAFDRAAALYERVLAMTPASDPQQRALRERHGDALAHAGRGPEAATAYERAASLCQGDDALELRRRAAEQLLGTGHVEAGTAVLGEVCAQLDLHVPQHASAALLSLAGTQARLFLSDLDREPSPAAASGRDALRLRTARTLVTGVLGYLPLHGASSAGRYLLMALAANDRGELVRALGFTAYWQTLVHPGSRRAGRLLARMEALAERDASRELQGFASLMRGMAAFHHDGYKLSATHLARAKEQLHGCPGTEWEIDAAHVYEQMCAAHLGHYERLVHTTPPLIEEAFRRGRVWAGAMLSGFAGMPAWLCFDDPQGYRAQLREARGRWQEQMPLRWPDYFMLVGEATLEIYTGRPAHGFSLLDERHAAYQRSRLTTGASLGAAGYAGHLARCAASALRTAGTRTSQQRSLWRQAIEDARHRLTQLGSVRGQAAAHALQAALALDLGETERASVALRRAVADFDAAELGLCAAAARRRLGQLLAGDQGRELLAAGEAFMNGQGVKNIEALTELGCPGCRV